MAEVEGSACVIDRGRRHPSTAIASADEEDLHSFKFQEQESSRYW